MKKMKAYPKMYSQDSKMARGSNERYMGDMKLGNGVMGHASKVHSINPMPNRDYKKVKKIDSYYSNTPVEAFGYEY